MRIAITSIALLAVLATPAAFANDRMSDVDYLRANQCLAHFLAQEEPAFVTVTLEEEVDRQARNREPFLVQEARQDTRAIARQWRRADTDGERQVMAEHQAHACAGFETLTAGLSSRG